jgi:hypothetical protein
MITHVGSRAANGEHCGLGRGLGRRGVKSVTAQRGRACGSLDPADPVVRKRTACDAAKRQGGASAALPSRADGRHGDRRLTPVGAVDVSWILSRHATGSATGSRHGLHRASGFAKRFYRASGGLVRWWWGRLIEPPLR